MPASIARFSLRPASAAGTSHPAAALTGCGGFF